MNYLLRQPNAQTMDPWFVSIFDDDFRPDIQWLKKAADAFKLDSDLAGLTGHVLADGINTEFGLKEEDALSFLDGTRAPQSHWTNAAEVRHIEGVYGCNMAFNQEVSSNVRFDENLPLYAWQEDFDFASCAKRFGHIALVPACRGVHLGASSGRTSGVRFGYSQIANPIYLVRKGTMSCQKARSLMVRNLASNILRTLTINRKKDYFGRLRGNLLAATDLLRRKLNPLRVVSL